MKKGSLSYCGGNDSGDSGSEEGMTQGKRVIALDIPGTARGLLHDDGRPVE